MSEDIRINLNKKQEMVNNTNQNELKTNIGLLIVTVLFGWFYDIYKVFSFNHCIKQ